MEGAPGALVTSDSVYPHLWQHVGVATDVTALSSEAVATYLAGVNRGSPVATILLRLRVCNTCRFPLPDGGFYHDKKSRDGLSFACRECSKARSRAWTKDNREHHTRYSALWRAANPERQKLIQDRAARTPAGKRNAKLYKQRNRHKVRARGAVNNHKRAGKLNAQPCESCGAIQAQAHHEDYNRPLDVTWLCQSCHSRHHKEHET